jgi:hypothetical protein
MMGVKMMKKRGQSETVLPVAVERRSGKDRRTKRFGDIRWFLKTGRRRQIRRKADRRKLFLLDYYSPQLFNFIVLILFLSVIDAYLTLWLIDEGAVEINPVMAYYLSLGPKIFLAVKYFLTVSAIMVVVLMNYAITRIIPFQYGQLLKFFAGCFGMVVAWELYLLARYVI